VVFEVSNIGTMDDKDVYVMMIDNLCHPNGGQDI